MRHAAALTAVLLLLTIATGACTPGAGEVTLEEQVPAAQRSATAAPAPQGDSSGEAAQLLTFVAGDIFYEDPPATAQPGVLTIEIQNVGNLDHNVVFEGFNDEGPVAEAPGGGTDRGTIELDAGNYVFYCSIPGHREAGMEGGLDVSA